MVNCIWDNRTQESLCGDRHGEGGRACCPVTLDDVLYGASLGAASCSTCLREGERIRRESHTPDPVSTPLSDDVVMEVIPPRCTDCGKPREVGNAVLIDGDWFHPECPTRNADPVSTPLHYRWHPSGVECIDIASAFDYALGNVIKYVWRCDYKGKAVEDLKKARTYLDRAIAERESETST